MIYLDNNATTRLAPPVLDAMRSALENDFGNPSSAYNLGKTASALVAKAREQVATLVGTMPDEIVFTASGTESDNWAIHGALDAQPGKDHIVITAVEHEAVRKTCEKLATRGVRVSVIDVDEQGALDIDALTSAVDERTALVSVMMANNETGILFPVAEIAERVKTRSNALVHVDGVNAVGKVPVDLSKTRIDLFSMSAHKFHGPKGIGALYIRDGVELPPIYTGGGQERGRRAGTEAVHQIVGIGAAAEFVKDLSQMTEIAKMRDRLEDGILKSIPDSYVNGTRDASRRLPNTSYISFENTNGEAILAKLDATGVCVSTGSACNSQDHSASAVLQAMNVPYARAMGAIRFSLGRFNRVDEIDHVLKVLPEIVSDLRKLAN